MELRLIFILFRRWLWLLILGALLGGAAGYLWSRSQPAVYQASTKVLILGTNELDELSRRASTEELIRTYTQLLLTRPVLDAASEQLGYRVRGGQISVQPVPRTRMFQVTVQGPGRQEVAATANALVDTLIEQNDNLQFARFASSAAGLQSQLAEVEGQLADIEAEIAEIAQANRAAQIARLEEQIETLEVATTNLQRDILNVHAAAADDDGIVSLSLEDQATIAEKEAAMAALNDELDQYRSAYIDIAVLGRNPARTGEQSVRLNQLDTQLALYQDIYTNLLSDYETTRLANLNETPNVVQVDRAVPPAGAIQPRPVQTGLMAAAVGLLLAGAVAFVVEYLDNTVKSDETIQQLTDAPIISHIASVNPRSKTHVVRALTEPRSPFAESFRALRTNLEFVRVDMPLRTLLVTSAGPTEGKSTVVANLAAVIAQAGQRVIIVDADLRRPRQQRFFQLPNNQGLTDALINVDALLSLLQGLPQDEHIKVLTSGSLPPNPTELLRTERMTQLLQRLQEEADFVLVDGPPFVVTDPTVLATKVDGILPVIRHAQTDVNGAAAMFKQLERARARVVGVVVNGIEQAAYGSYYSYHAYQYYYSQPRRKRPFPWGRNGEQERDDRALRDGRKSKTAPQAEKAA